MSWKLGCAVLSLVVLSSACKKQGESYTPTIMDITKAVYSSVTVEPDSLYEVFASVSGIVQDIKVDEGDTVSSGDILLSISNTVPKLNAQNAKLALDQARVNAGKNSSILASILDEINSASLAVENNKLNYKRQQELWRKGIGSKANLEQKQLAYESSENQLSMLKSKFERTKLELRTQLNQARVVYESTVSNSGDFIIRSRINGRVYSILKNEGETVSPQMPLATIGSASGYSIKMLIDEVDITEIEKGQTVYLTLDAYGKQSFRATVSKIYPSKDLRTQTFLVEGEFVDLPTKLYPGLTGEANIVIQTKKSAIVIPNELVNEDNRVNTASGLVEIVPGIKSMEYTEVISGIDSSTVLLPLE